MMRFWMALAGGVIAAGMVVSAPAQAQSLAGDAGKRHYPVQFPPSPKDPCKLAYKAYVAASGHSAYAQTAAGAFANVEAFFCGIARNAPSQKIAQERALADCKRVGQKYKVKTAGACHVYASK